jgi:hypothetical protein
MQFETADFRRLRAKRAVDCGAGGGWRRRNATLCPNVASCALVATAYVVAAVGDGEALPVHATATTRDCLR